MENFSYICDCPSGRYILMKVFSLLSLGEIWEISTVSRIGNSFITLLGVSCVLHIAITGVGYCLFDTGFPEPLPDKRKMLHTFFLYNPFKEQDDETNNYVHTTTRPCLPCCWYHLRGALGSYLWKSERRTNGDRYFCLCPRNTKRQKRKK